MLSTISLWNYHPPTPLYINDFKEIRYVLSNNNYKKLGGVMLEYYNNKDEKIGYIRYYITTGQIGLFYIDENYQNRGLGKQILYKVIKELKTNHCEEVWVVSTSNHRFWLNRTFTPRSPIHPTVTGSGYFMKLQNCDV